MTYWLGPERIDPPAKGPPPITGLLALGLAGAVLGSVASNLDTRLTTFSLADLRGGTGLGVDEASWVSLAYNVAEIAVVPITPWLAQVLSPRRAIAIAVSLLTVAAAFLPVAAPDLRWLVLLRLVQGMGGGALIPLLLLAVLRFTPAHQRVFGLTMYGFVTACTPLVAEILAGELLNSLGWQSIFYISLPIGPAVVALVMIGLPVEKVKLDAFAKVDYGGMVLLAVFAGTLTAALGQGQRLDWFDSWLVDLLLGVSAAALLAFVMLELSLEHPLIDFSLFKRRNFSLGLLMIFAYGFQSLFTGSVLPQFAEAVQGFRELQVGEILIWGSLVQIAACAAAPFLLRVVEARVALALALFGAVLGCRLATYISSDWVGGNFLPGMLIQVACQPLLLVPLTVVTTSVLKPEDALSGGTVFNVMRNLVLSVSSSTITAILTVRERVHSEVLTEHLHRGAPVLVLREAQQGLAALAAAVRAQATTMAVADAFGWLGVAAMVPFVILLLLRPTPMPRAPRG